MTTGYLLEAFISGSRLFGGCTHILLDEVHERGLQSDMLSLVLKTLLSTDRELAEEGTRKRKKLVVMSATIQADMFRHYFSDLAANGDVPMLHVGARRCKVDELFLGEALEKMQSRLPLPVRSTLEHYLDKLKHAGPCPFRLQGDVITAISDMTLACVAPGQSILVFLPGLEDIENTLESVKAVTKKVATCDVRLFVLHSIVELKEQERVLQPVSPSECKIVLATNIAETSLTLPDVKVVIDVGIVRRMEYDQQKQIRCLACKWCSKSSAKQRAGRAGRVSDGTVIRMYTAEVMSTRMEDYDSSEFLPLEYSVLQVREHLNAYGTVEEVMAKLIEPPPDDAVAKALENLVNWGALGHPPSYEVKELGSIALRMPIDVQLTKSILNGASVGCAAEMTVVAAGLTAQRPLFIHPLRNFFENDYDYLRAVFGTFKAIHHFDCGQRSDLHVFLAIYEELGDMSMRERAKCREQLDIALRPILTFFKYVRQIAMSLESCKVWFHDEDHERLRQLQEGERVRFPVFDRFSTDAVFRAILASSADVVITAKKKTNKTFWRFSEAKERSDAARCIVFDGIPKEAEENPALRTGLAAVTGEDVRVDSTVKRVVTLRFPESKNSSDLSIPVHPCVHALCMLKKLHSAREVRIALAKEPADGYDFPTPCVACRTDGCVGYREWSKFPVFFDRWSVCTAPSVPKEGDPTSELFFALSGYSLGSGLSASSGFAGGHDPFLALMSSPLMMSQPLTLRFDMRGEYIVKMFAGPPDEEPTFVTDSFRARVDKLVEVCLIRILVFLARSPNSMATEKLAIKELLQQLLRMDKGSSEEEEEQEEDWEDVDADEDAEREEEEEESGWVGVEWSLECSQHVAEDWPTIIRLAAVVPYISPAKMEVIQSARRRFGGLDAPLVENVMTALFAEHTEGDEDADDIVTLPPNRKKARRAVPIPKHADPSSLAKQPTSPGSQSAAAQSVAAEHLSPSTSQPPAARVPSNRAKKGQLCDICGTKKKKGDHDMKPHHVAAALRCGAPLCRELQRHEVTMDGRKLLVAIKKKQKERESVLFCLRCQVLHKTLGRLGQICDRKAPNVLCSSQHSHVATYTG